MHTTVGHYTYVPRPCNQYQSTLCLMVSSTMISNRHESNIVPHLMCTVVGHDLFQCFHIGISPTTLVESQCPVAVGVSMNDVMWTIGAHGGMCGRPMTS